MLPFLKNPSLNLNTLTIDTSRCILQVFHIGIDFELLTRDFCEANKDLFVSQFLPSVDEEKIFIQETILKRNLGEAIEFFIYEKKTGAIVGCCGINALNTKEPNIGLWIKTSMHGQGLGSEVYQALLSWTKENTLFSFLKHCCHPKNEASIKLAEKFGGILQDERDERSHLKFFIDL